jgi:hypothetical protein
MHAEATFDPSTPLATATVQDIHLELIRRSEHNAFHGERVLADLLTHRQDWQAVLFDTYGLATDRGLPAHLVLCQTSKLGLPWQFNQVNQEVRCIITLKSQFDRALVKLRDMASNDYNADTLYILAVNEEAAHRLTALAEAWGAEPHIYGQEETERALGTSRDNGCLVQMWWD